MVHCLSSLLRPRTCADGIIITAVADVFHFKIRIIESGPDFVEAVTNVTLPQEQCTILLSM